MCNKLLLTVLILGLNIINVPVIEAQRFRLNKIETEERLYL